MAVLVTIQLYFTTLATVTQQKLVSRWGVGKHITNITIKYIYISISNKKYITWNQYNPVEGMEGKKESLCLKSDSNCAVFAS